MYSNIGIYITYAALNTAAMVAIKYAFGALSRENWPQFIKSICTCGLLYLSAIFILMLLLSRFDASVAFPTAIGCTVLATNIVELWIYPKEFCISKTFGTGMVLIGIFLIYLN